MRFPSTLRRGILLKRYRRFLADIRLDDGTVVTAHCPSSGTLRSCSEPGSVVLVSDSSDPARRHPLTWELTDISGSLVCINTALCRKLMLNAVEEHTIPPLAFFHELQYKAESGLHGTVDMLLHGMERNRFVNLYGVTWAEDATALFPDAPGTKATASLRQLTEIARRGHQAIALFLVQRSDCSLFKPAEEMDRTFMKAMLQAQSSGVEMLVYATQVTTEGIALGPPLPVSLA
jgi:sugar fermentation stimulation protein A